MEKNIDFDKFFVKSDLIPAIIYTFILLPIIVGGLGVFGWYSLQGEYSDDKL